MISIILPMYNEEKNVKPQIKQIRQHVKTEHEIICVANGCTDNTIREIIKAQHKYKNIELEILPEPNLKKALIKGFQKAKGGTIITMDADLTHHPKLIKKMDKQIKKGNDLIIASRYVKKAEEGSTTTRRIISKTANTIAQKILNTKVKDITSGYRAYNNKIKNVKLKQQKGKGFEAQIEILHQLEKQNIKTKEIPIILKTRKHGTSKLGTKEIIEWWKTIIKIGATK